MRPLLRCLLPALMLLGLPIQAAQCLVIGDSLTKEYEVEFPLLFPQNPASWDSRNWIEILHERRNAWFDLGEFDGYLDPRLTGHEHNWAFPGATTTEIRNQLSSIANFWWIDEFEDQLTGAADRVVIFAGGNDVDSYYGQIYNGTSATSYINKTRDNLKWIVDYVRSVKSSLPIVLVSVPHLGCSPDVQRQWPTDAVKTGRVTAALDSLNAQLATYAQSKGIGFVPGVYQMTKDIISGPFTIGGVEFIKQADPDSRPLYVFSGDGFHPATSAQAKIAQMVIEAFRTKYPNVQITPLTDEEILSSVLGLNTSVELAYNTWINTQNVPAGKTGLQDDPDGDSLVNGVEFVLEGGAASVPNPELMQPVIQTVNGQKYLTWTYRLRASATAWGPSRVQQSTDLKAWSDTANAAIISNSDGSKTLRLPLNKRQFVRLKVDR